MENERQEPPDIAIARLAGRQRGVVSAAQLRAAGLGRTAIHTRARAGRLHRLHRGVYAVGHRSLTQDGRWLAAVLATGPRAGLSHAAAIAHWQLRPVRGGPIDVSVVARGRRSRPGLRIHSVAELELVTRNGIPVTTVERTLLDYAEIASEPELRLAIEAADRRELFDLAAIEALIERSPGRRGLGRLTRTLATMRGHATPDTRSELENRMLVLCRSHGLPEPLTNVLVHGELVDCYWPRARAWSSRSIPGGSTGPAASSSAIAAATPS